MQKLSNNYLAVLLAYKKGYRVINGEVYSPYGNKRKLIRNRKSKKHPYYKFTIKASGKRNAIPVEVHQLVAYQKYGNKLFEDGLVVRHINGNPLDNREENIELGTLSENMLDRPVKDRWKHAKLAASHIRKYDDKIIEEIKTLRKEGWTYKELMNKFNISSTGQLHFLLNKERYLKYPDGDKE